MRVTVSRIWQTSGWRGANLDNELRFRQTWLLGNSQRSALSYESVVKTRNLDIRNSVLKVVPVCFECNAIPHTDFCFCNTCIMVTMVCGIILKIIMHVEAF